MATRGLSRSGWSRLLDSDARRGNSPRKGFFHRCSMRFTTVSDAEEKAEAWGATQAHGAIRTCLFQSGALFLFLLKRFGLGTAPIWMSQLKPSCWKSRYIFKKLMERLLESPHLPTRMSCNKSVAQKGASWWQPYGPLWFGKNTSLAEASLPRHLSIRIIRMKGFKVILQISLAMSSRFPTNTINSSHDSPPRNGVAPWTTHAPCMTCIMHDMRWWWWEGHLVPQDSTTKYNTCVNVCGLLGHNEPSVIIDFLRLFQRWQNRLSLVTTIETYWNKTVRLSSKVHVHSSWYPQLNIR